MNKDEIYQEIQKNIGNYKKLLPLLVAKSKIIEKETGIESLKYVASLNEVGGAYKYLGKYPESEIFFKYALSIIEKILGVKDANYATTLNNLAGLYRLMKKYGEAELLFKQAIIIYEDTLDQNHFLTISSYNNLGLLYQDLGNLKKAEELYEKCLNLISPQKSDHPLAYATTLNNLASIYFDSNTQKAINILDEVKILYAKEIGENHHLYATCLNNLATLYHKIGNKEKANNIIPDALRITKEVFGQNSTQYKMLINNINKINIISGKEYKNKKVKLDKNFANSFGMNLSFNFFNEYVFPTIIKEYTQEEIKCMAFGLVGEGSECFGFDDIISRDHDFGTRIMIWLPNEKFNLLSARLEQTLANLYDNQNKYVKSNSSKYAPKREGVFAIEEFYYSFLGTYAPPNSISSWLSLKEERLASVTNGQVFYDNFNEFSTFRNKLLQYYPEDIRIFKIAYECSNLGKEGQYNYPRMLKRNEKVALKQIEGICINSIIAIIYLLNKTYRPFHKWSHKKLTELAILGNYTHQLLINLINANEQEKTLYIEDFCKNLLQELQKQSITNKNNDFMFEQASIIINNCNIPKYIIEEYMK